MKYIKLFEQIYEYKQPDVGDYCILFNVESEFMSMFDFDFDDERYLKTFLLNNIAIIYDFLNNDDNYDISLEFKTTDKRIHKIITKQSGSHFTSSDGIIFYSYLNSIKYFSKSENDLKMKMSANKYNL